MRVLVSIQMGWFQASFANLADLRRKLALDFLGSDPPAAHPCDQRAKRSRQSAGPIRKRWNLSRIRNRCPSNENQVAANSQPWVRARSRDCIVERLAICHQRRARQDPFAMRADNRFVHPARQAEIIGVQN